MPNAWHVPTPRSGSAGRVLRRSIYQLTHVSLGRWSVSNLSIVPLRSFFDVRLNRDDILLLGVICCYTDRDGFCYPGLTTISMIFSPLVGRVNLYDASSISRKMQRLEMFGYLVNTEQRHNASRSFSSNRYKILYDPKLPTQFDRRSKGEPLELPSGEMQAGTPLENASVQIQTVEPLANANVKIQVPLENPPGEKQAPLESASVEIHTNDPVLTSQKVERHKGGREKHTPPPPAVRVFREVRRKYPVGELWTEIDQTVGSSPDDLEFWNQVLVRWAGCGYNPMAVDGPLDYFRRRELPGGKRRAWGVPDLVPVPAGMAQECRSDYSDAEWRRTNPLMRRSIIAFETGRNLADVEDDPGYKGAPDA